MTGGHPAKEMSPRKEVGSELRFWGPPPFLVCVFHPQPIVKGSAVGLEGGISATVSLENRALSQRELFSSLKISGSVPHSLGFLGACCSCLVFYFSLWEWNVGPTPAPALYFRSTSFVGFHTVHSWRAICLRMTHTWCLTHF